jgi:hypothetical protein
MKIIKNKIFPFGNFKAITIWPFIFAKVDLNDVDICHEKIHGEQQKELLLIGFYILYIIFTIIYGYKKNPFEREAYTNEKYIHYHKFRSHFEWFKLYL